MTISLASPNTDNYPIGKGIVSIKLAGAGAYVDIGNVSELEVTPNITKLPHFSSRTGTKTKDREIVTEKSGTLRMVMDEATGFNMALLMMSTAVVAGGVATIDIWSGNSVVAAVKFVATNDIGPKWNLDFPRVEFAPSKSFSPISDEWETLEVSGEVTAVSGSFGTASATFTDTIPVNTVLPQIITDGTPNVGNTLTVYPGAWNGSPATYTYVWKNATVPISGETNSYYIPITADIGDSITVTVTATNGAGAASATSPAVVILA